MTDPEAVLEETAEELFEDAPCGYLSTAPDGTILRVNRTFEALTGLSRDDLVGRRRRFQDLLTPGGRIYHETHYAPLLRMQGSVRAIALEIVRADGSRLPALVNSVLVDGDGGSPRLVRTTVFDATDRRRYEQELLDARRREHDIALDLQRSMLAGELPADDALEIGVLYRPAVRGLEVGGDWYDAFRLDRPGTVGVVVGDVVGRGIGAAATMGQLRSAVRALASTGLGPGALLEGLDHYARRYGVGQMATVVYAEIDVHAPAARYACAGHPPPVVTEPGREPRLEWQGRSLPLDALRSPTTRPEGELALAPGATLVLYTDGLVESRELPLDAGLDQLVGHTARLRDRPTDVLATGLADALAPQAEHSDDVCVLAVRVGATAPAGASSGAPG